MSIPESVMSILREKISNIRAYLKEIVPSRADEISAVDFDADDINRYFTLFLLTGMNGSHIYDIVRKKFSISDEDARLREYCDCIFTLLSACAH